MKKKRKLNVRLLRRIQKHILEEPRRFFMSSLKHTGEPGTPTPGHNWDEADTFPECGTIACIAGWAQILEKDKDKGQFRGQYAAQFLLGVTNEQAEALYFDYKWPEPFCSRYSNAKRSATRAKIACARIDYLIEHGE